MVVNGRESKVAMEGERVGNLGKTDLESQAKVELFGVMSTSSERRLPFS